MKILDRYVILSFLKNYVITFGVLVGMYVILDMVFNFDELVDIKGGEAVGGGVATMLQVARNVVDYYFFQSFLFFTNLSPVIPGVAASFTLIRLSRSNELVAVMAAGVPLLRVAAPIILVAVVLSSLVVLNQELVIPQLIPQLTRKHDQVGAGYVAPGRPVHGIRDADSNAWLRAGLYTAPTPHTPATIDWLDVLERTAEGQVVGHLSADRAVWDPDSESWTLTNGWYVSGLSPNGGGGSVLPPEPRTEARTTVTPEVIALYRSMDVAELLPTRRINELLARPQAFGQAELVKVKHTRWAGVLLNIVMLLLSIPAVLSRDPTQVAGSAVRTGLLIAGVMGLVFITHNLAASPPRLEWLDQWAALMAFLPVFIFGPVAVYLLRQVKT